LTELFVTKLKPEAERFQVWDRKQAGLALSCEPTGFKAYKCVYSFHSRPRWYDLGKASAIGLANARKLARDIQYRVAQGQDPQAERKAQRMAGTFEELAQRYRDEWAIKRNKSWKQARTLVERYVLPRWAKLKPDQITRSDVKALLATIDAPVLANQVLASASAIFTWAIRQEVVTSNPCKLVDRNKVASRERVLSDSELPLFWSAFGKAGTAGTALKVLLLCGQRPGEISCMRREHIEDFWWTMPGEPVEALKWPGTKNGATHRVWLPKPVQELIATDSKTGFVFAGRRGKATNKALDSTMRAICDELGIADTVRPHDLRRTHGTKITALGFGRDAMNRIQNHREGGIADVYDRHRYEGETKHVMESVASAIIALAEGKQSSNVVAFR